MIHKICKIKYMWEFVVNNIFGTNNNYFVDEYDGNLNMYVNNNECYEHIWFNCLNFGL